ncbi:hypothetical protein [uncultured Desulfovibrio sp.]|uniref:hypothetical protein n=1 Tax=uncultured Desulfovibrio sp. TaxID=167968 RepID=UPI0026219E9A|nr:hypothetical protein [uncultured Desulfovibrio sp.]
MRNIFDSLYVLGFHPGQRQNLVARPDGFLVSGYRAILAHDQHMIPVSPIAVSRQLAAQIAHRQGAYFRQINTPLRIHSSGHPLWGSGSVKAQFHAV